MGETIIPTFLKWAGGKGRLISQYRNLFPEKIERYFEPFLGSGVIFFYIKQIFNPKFIMLSDINDELINCWQVVRDDVEELIGLLEVHKEKHNKGYYYSTRALLPKSFSAVQRAARLIYLNRTCFNGLYRVNSKGEFNVPMGDYKNPRILDVKNLKKTSKLLKGLKIETRSYNNILKQVKKGDFVYMDPPYYPISDTSSFTSYTEYPFLEKEQEELANFCKKLDKKGCKFILSNSDCKFIRNLYKDFKIIPITAKRMISADSSKRGDVKELVALNYKPKSVGTQLTLF